jgi:hypothetical protein
VIWLQPYRSSDTSVAGSRLTVELRLSTRPETGGDGYRTRLPALLTDDERNEIRHLTIGSDEDPWFRYLDDADARALMAVLARLLPTVIDRFLDAATTANQG